MGDYWNERFGNGGKVWGVKPSDTAIHAKSIFESNAIQEILVVGSGYGRHSNYFFNEGINVEGVEYSEEGIKLAREDNPEIVYYHGSAFDLPFDDKKYNGIYCYNVLHLFMKELRRDLVERCYETLQSDGIMYFVTFSEQEASFGTGIELEDNTYEHKKGKPVHYYTDEDLRSEFHKFTILDTGLYVERESHGDEGEHEHVLRYIVVKK